MCLYFFGEMIPTCIGKKNADEIDSSGQFHQRFTRAFLESLFGSFFPVSNPKHSFLIFGSKISYEKCTRKTLMK